jgi:peptidoglycan/xylan/chitin deacetylase (PgdA/CDA1 family)
VRYPLVLCYHAASAAWDDALSIPPEAILGTVQRLLRRGYRGVTTAEAGKPGTGRRLHVTFDDAYRSIAGTASELVELGVGVTVFACSGYADTGAPLAVPELAEEARAHPIELATMTWDDLAALVRSGVAIGSHTVSHPHLPALSLEEMTREIHGSRASIEQRLGVECETIAYPYGEHDEQVRAAVRAAGYQTAFALARSGNFDVYAVPRVDLYRRDSTFVTRLKTGAARRPLVALLDRTGVRRTKRQAVTHG